MKPFTPSLHDALQSLLKAARTLDSEQGRMARRNARRRVFGAARAVANVVERCYPVIAKPPRLVDAIEAASLRMTWKQFEYHIIKFLTIDWDAQLAQQFIERVSKKYDVPVRELVIEDPKTMKRMLGQCCEDRIRLREDLGTPEKWRTLIHEVAHAIVRVIPLRRWELGIRSHGRRFVLAMAQVYREWIAFRVDLRVAAKRGEQTHEGQREQYGK